MYLYHYYDKKVGPFRNLSDLSFEEAEMVLAKIRKEKPQTQCAFRQQNYIKDRLFYEDILRTEFKKKHGKIERFVPHYMVVEHSPWLNTWYEDCAVIKIPIEEFDIETLSFTYGDSHPTFSPRIKDGKADKVTLVSAIKQADKECGSCGCNLDPLYKRVLELL